MGFFDDIEDPAIKSLIDDPGFRAGLELGVQAGIVTGLLTIYLVVFSKSG